MTKRQEPEGFAEYWAIWRPHARHTDGRGLARDTFAKHLKDGADPQDIIDGARCFFRTIKERDREFVPLSSTWLNRRAYEDLAEQERTYQQRVAEAQARSHNVVPLSQSIDPNRRAQMVANSRRITQGMRSADA